MTGLQHARCRPVHLRGAQEWRQLLVNLGTPIDQFKQPGVPVHRLERLTRGLLETVRQDHRRRLVQALHILEMAEHGPEANARALRHLLGTGRQVPLAHERQQRLDDPLLAVMAALPAPVGGSIGAVRVRLDGAGRRRSTRRSQGCSGGRRHHADFACTVGACGSDALPGGENCSTLSFSDPKRSASRSRA